MEFCPECGAMMLPNNGVLKCNKCGYSNELGNNKEYKVSEEINAEETVKMLGEDVDVGPITNETCPECGHDKATYKMLMKLLHVFSHVPNVYILGEHMTKRFTYEKF